MGPRALELVAGVIDQIERAVTGAGRPPVLTTTVLETLRFFLSEGVQWREFRASTARFQPQPSPCCIVEHANAWLLANKRLDRRHGRLGAIVDALLTAACIFVIASRLGEL